MRLKLQGSSACGSESTLFERRKRLDQINWLQRDCGHPANQIHDELALGFGPGVRVVRNSGFRIGLEVELIDNQANADRDPISYS